MTIDYIGWDIHNLFYKGTRFNNGTPYKFLRIGPIFIKRYL
jgi:hypothetical protein